jgi:hypothetical protein
MVVALLKGRGIKKSHISDGSYSRINKLNGGNKMRRFNKLLGILLSLCFLVVSVNAATPDSLNNKKVKQKIDPLLASKEYKYKIVKISDPFNDIIAVFINPSCRDFPNVIFFSYDQSSNDYKRVYEGLGIGIQDEPSGKVDFHTLGLGMDMKFDKDTNDFESEPVRKMIELGNKSGFVVIPYQNFIHMQGGSKEFYTIDKTKYRDFALKLIGDVYDKYPKDTCIMFDTPNLIDAQFIYDNGKYIVTGKTDNNQLWTITFDGVDTDNKYLLNKKIEVEKL